MISLQLWKFTYWGNPFFEQFTYYFRINVLYMRLI